MESPAAYVADFKRNTMSAFMKEQAKIPQVDTDDMTIEELRAYYDAGGARRLQNLSSS